MFGLTSRRLTKTAANINDRLRSENELLRQKILLLNARIRELESLAGEDHLIGIPNRRSFEASLQHIIARVSRHDVQATIIFIDVDGLKQINDSGGHHCGDAALVRVGKIIKETIRSSDLVGRLGGDEFAVILERSDELQGWQMALRIVERVAASQLIVSGRSLNLSVSVGVAPIKADDDCASVLNRADEQMYRIKRPSGKQAPSNPRRQ